MIKWTIKRKLVGTVTGLIAFFGILAVVSIFSYTKKTLTNFQKQNISLNTQILAGKVSKVFAESFEVVNIVANNTQVEEYLLSKSDAVREQLIEHEVLESMNRDGKYSAIYLMDSMGLTLLSTDKSFEGKNYAFRDYFQQAIQGKSYIDVSMGVTSGVLGYYFASPVINQGQVLGVVVLKLKPEYVNQALGKGGGKAKNIESFLVDEYGVVVSATQSDKMFGSLGRLSQENREILLNKKRYADKSINELDYGEVMENLSEIKEPIVFSIYHEKDKQEDILGVTKVEGTEFYFMSEVSGKEMQKIAENVGLLTSLFVAIAAIMAMLLIGLIVQKLVKPIELLRRQVETIAKGDLEKELKLKTGDELEDLANGLNEMTIKLRESYINIEQKVEERTRELKKLNKYMVGREIKMRELKKKMKNMAEERGEK